MTDPTEVPVAPHLPEYVVVARTDLPQRKPTVTVDGVLVPGVDRVEVRQVGPMEWEDLPASDAITPLAPRVYELVINIVAHGAPPSTWALHFDEAIGPDGRIALETVRPTAAARTSSGRPVFRDHLAAALRSQWSPGVIPERPTGLVSRGEVRVVVQLLEEYEALLAPDEPLRGLVRQVIEGLVKRATSR